MIEASASACLILATTLLIIIPQSLIFDYIKLYVKGK